MTTTQEINTLEERGENRLTTDDLAAANDTTSAAATTIPKTAHQPNLRLFAQNDTQDFRSRWEKIQNGFVDEPRTAVVQADELVATAIKRRAEGFCTARRK